MRYLSWYFRKCWIQKLFYSSFKQQISVYISIFTFITCVVVVINISFLPTINSFNKLLDFFYTYLYFLLINPSNVLFGWNSWITHCTEFWTKFLVSLFKIVEILYQKPSFVVHLFLGVELLDKSSLPTNIVQFWSSKK